MTGRLTAGLFTKLTLVAAIWGGTFIAGRVASLAMGPTAAAMWRYVVAAVVLLVIVVVREGGLPRLSARQWTGVILLGATGVTAYNLFFMYGLERVSASRGSLIMALNPVAIMVGGALFLHERITGLKVAGMVLALAGVAVVLGHGNPAELFSGHVGVGELALFGCVISWATYTLLGKRILDGMSPLVASTYASLVGAVLLTAAAALTGGLRLPPMTWEVAVALVFLGVFGTAVAFVWFYDGVRAIGPARTGIFINLVPVFAILLGVALLGEKVEAAMLVGATMVLGGVFLVNRPVAAPSVAIAQGAR